MRTEGMERERRLKLRYVHVPAPPEERHHDVLPIQTNKNLKPFKNLKTKYCNIENVLPIPIFTKWL